MTFVNVPSQCPPRIQVARWVRNGKLVDARFASELATDANHAAIYCTRQVMRGFGACSNLAGGGSGLVHVTSDIRWRHAWHAAPQTNFLLVHMVTNVTNAPGDLGTYSTYVLSHLNGSVIASVLVNNERKASPAGTPNEWTDHFALIGPITGDADYEGYFQEYNSGLVSACAYEIALKPDTTNGYASQAFASGTAIYDADRQVVELLASAQWDRGAASTFQFFIDRDAAPYTMTGATAVNFIDGSSTPTANTPGYTIDLRNRNSVARGTVGMKGWVYGKRSNFAAPNAQHLIIVDSAGTHIVDVVGFLDAGGPSWIPFTFDLPATRAKYDLYVQSTNGTFTFYAVSVQEMT